MFLRVEGVKVVPFWPTATLWLRGPVGVAEVEVVVEVVVVESLLVDDAAVVDVLIVENPDADGTV